MTANQLKAAMAKLDLTQIALANLLEQSDRNVRRWMKGQWPIPVTVAMLLYLMLDTQTAPDDLRR
jgi:transcriptional regulator with XRE-family HTH domain